MIKTITAAVARDLMVIINSMKGISSEDIRLAAYTVDGYKLGPVTLLQHGNRWRIDVPTEFYKADSEQIRQLVAKAASGQPVIPPPNLVQLNLLEQIPPYPDGIHPRGGKQNGRYFRQTIRIEDGRVLFYWTKEMVRRSKTGQKVYVQLPDKPEKITAAQELANGHIERLKVLFEKAGYRVVRWKDEESKDGDVTYIHKYIWVVEEESGLPEEVTQPEPAVKF